MRYAQTLSVYIIYSNKAVYYPSCAGIIRIRSEGIISAAPKQERHPWLFNFLFLFVLLRFSLGSISVILGLGMRMLC